MLRLCQWNRDVGIRQSAGFATEDAAMLRLYRRNVRGHMLLTCLQFGFVEGGS
jgi:hypothetical protein